jgi:hypothetical protein
MERLLEAKTVVIGREYLVPSMPASSLKLEPTGKPCTTLAEFIPISGVPHNDAAFGFGDDYHVHFDFRFLHDKIYDILLSTTKNDDDVQSYERKPTSVLRFPAYLGTDHSGIVERPFRCLRKPPLYQIRQCGFMLLTLQGVFSGKAVAPAKPICPHHGAILSGMTRRGCLTCPNHGLRFSAATGKMVKRRIPKYCEG